MRSRRRVRLAIAMAIALVVTSQVPQAAAEAIPSGLPAETSSVQVADRRTDPTELSALIPTADSLRAVQADLPADPVASTEALVGEIFGDNPQTAVSATAEILRRAGIPLVSGYGPVIALADDVNLTNVPIDVEFLPTLTDSVRSGQQYDLDQVAEILHAAAPSAPELTGKQLITVLAAWGKNSGAPIASVVAGTAVRALGANERRLLMPSAVADKATLAALHSDPNSLDAGQLGLMTGAGRLTGLDELQVVLLLAHLGGETHFGVVTERVIGLRSDGAWLRNSRASVCDDLKLDEVQDTAKGLGKKWYQGQLKAAVAAQYGESAAKDVSNALQGYDFATDVLSTLIFLTGVHVSLTAAHPGGVPATSAQTHFRHVRTDVERNLVFTVTAEFQSAVPQEQLPCWNLAGVKVPKNGGLPDIGVTWRFTDPELLHPEPNGAWGGGPNPVLTATGKDGTATINTYPRTEKKPPTQANPSPEQQLRTDVSASLSKHDFTVHLKDLIKLAGGAEAFFASEAWKLLNNVIQSAGIPTPHMSVPVSYHGSDPYVIRDTSEIWIPPLAHLNMSADLYSCTGPAGPWRGTVVFSPAADAIAVAIADAFGLTGETTAGTLTSEPTFRLEVESANPQHISLPNVGNLAMVVELDPDAIASVNDDADVHSIRNVTQIGTAYWTLSDVDMRQLKDSNSIFASGVEFQVVAALTDSRCPGSSPWEDAFDAF